MTKPFAAMSITELRAGLAAREFSAREVAEGSLERVHACDGRVRAFLEVTEQSALEAADRIDAALVSGGIEAAGPLAGVPIAFKDNMNLAGARTTCGSYALGSEIASGTALCVQRMLDAGAIPLGKLNMDELAFGSSTETSVFGRTFNPWDTERVPGGSSGGSAAAVAAGLACVTLGSDAGGSIRQPASFCGVVAVKPGAGMVPSEGILALAGALDQAGPFARSVRDVATAQCGMYGVFEMMSTEWQSDADQLAHLFDGVRGMRIGVVPAFMEAKGLTSEVRAKVEEAAAHLTALGAQVVEVDLPHVMDAMSAYYVLGPCHAYANFAGCSGPMGVEAKRRVLLGAYLLSSAKGEEYRKAAQVVRARIAEDYAQVFSRVDCILAPTTPRTAFKFGEVTDPNEMHLSDMFTVSVNLSGNAAMSMPVGLGADTQLPVGVQLIASNLGLWRALRVAAGLEQVYGEAPVAPDFR